MQANLAVRLPLEVLYGIGDVNFFPVDACLFEAAIEELAGPTKGCPSLSSRSPGCSPTIMMRTLVGEAISVSPKTAWVAFL